VIGVTRKGMLNDKLKLAGDTDSPPIMLIQSVQGNSIRPRRQLEGCKQPQAAMRRYFHRLTWSNASCIFGRAYRSALFSSIYRRHAAR
jgi:hypothetical protein